MVTTQLWEGDCLQILPCLPDRCCDLVLCDLPYGTTACKWDSIIPFEPMWKELHRICKGAIALNGSEPFSSHLRLSNLKNFKYDWIWNKKLAGNGILAKKQPLKIHEVVSIFSVNTCPYFPQMTKGISRKKMTSGIGQTEILNRIPNLAIEYENNEYYPVSIQEFGIGNLRIGRLHPTQKPVALMEYLIRTYTNMGNVVLDFTMGSGTTGVAAIQTGRSFIGIEQDPKYFQIAKSRIEAAK